MLFVQGSTDAINPPWTSKQLYEADQERARYYLDLLGADHMTPYTGANPVERLVARVTLAFFNQYVLGGLAGHDDPGRQRQRRRRPGERRRAPALAHEMTTGDAGSPMTTLIDTTSMIVAAVGRRPGLRLAPGRS